VFTVKQELPHDAYLAPYGLLQIVDGPDAMREGEPEVRSHLHDDAGLW
jgi:hypothetical protein